MTMMMTTMMKILTVSSNELKPWGLGERKRVRGHVADVRRRSKAFLLQRLGIAVQCEHATINIQGIPTVHPKYTSPWNEIVLYSIPILT